MIVLVHNTNKAERAVDISQKPFQYYNKWATHPFTFYRHESLGRERTRNCYWQTNNKRVGPRSRGTHQRQSSCKTVPREEAKHWTTKRFTAPV